MTAEDALTAAEQHLAAFDPAAAENALTAAWRDMSDAPADVLVAMAMVRAQQYRLGDAEQLMRRAVAAEPHSLRCNIGLGHVLLSSEKPSEAADAYASAYRIDPNWPGLLQTYVHACYGAGRYDEAEKGARLLLTQDPSAAAWDLLSCALRGQGRAQEALDAANEALKLNASHVGARHSQGAALVKLGRAQEALKVFERLEADGASGAALSYNRAAALEKLGRSSEAKALQAETARRWPSARRPN